MKARAKLQQNPMKISRNNKIMANKLDPNTTISFFQTKSEILFNQKTFLEIILSFIKNVQVDYLNNNTLNENKDNSNNSIQLNNASKIKTVLKELKENLLEIKKEKDKNIELLIKQTEQKKDILRKTIFNTVYTKRSISNYNYINLKHETLITENNENYYNKETPELKLLNFKVENEIIKVDNLTQRVQLLIQYYKTPHKIEDHRTEIINESKKNEETINEILHDKVVEQRENFMDEVNQKSIQDLKISSLHSQIIRYRNELNDVHKSLKYVNTQEVITEENKSYLETIKEDEKNDNLTFRTSFSGTKTGATNNIINNNINNNNKSSKNIKYIDINDIEKLLKLNMNINVNINYNKQIINNHFDNNNNINDKVNNNEEDEDEDGEDNSSYYSKEQNIDDEYDIDSNNNDDKTKINNN